MRLLTDAEVHAAISAPAAIDLMALATVQSHRGELVSPPRPTIDGGGTAFTVTAGGRPGGTSGFRVYGSWGPGSDQFTAVWTGEGRLAGIVLGSALGMYRTGALGGVAVRALARLDATTLGVIGSGAMAWAQVWAACSARGIERVDIHSPTAERREAFARRVEAELGVEAHAVADAESVVAGHDILIVSTVATSPVLRAGWLAPGTHVSSTGPKARGASELAPELAALAAVVTSDSPQQVAAQGSWFSPRGVDHLGAIVAGDIPGRTTADEVTLYCSIGLSGTEVLLAESLLAG
jgi:alanine dehydrogenase